MRKKETREAETRHYRYHEKDTPDYIREEWDERRRRDKMRPKVKKRQDEVKWGKNWSKETQGKTYETGIRDKIKTRTDDSKKRIEEKMTKMDTRWRSMERKRTNNMRMTHWVRRNKCERQYEMRRELSKWTQDEKRRTRWDKNEVALARVSLSD